MKKYAKRIIKKTFEIPGMIDRDIQKLKDSILFHIRLRQKGYILSRNEKWRNIHKNEICFIVANGPSTRSVDLNLFKNYPTIFMNGFVNHRIDFSPTYAIFIDPLYVTTTDAMIKSELQCFEKHPNTEYFFIDLAYEFYNDMRNMSFLSFCGDFEEGGSPQLDITKPIPGCGTVAVAALIVANFMGFKEAFLLGYDHNWLAFRNHFDCPSVSSINTNYEDYKCCNPLDWPYEKVAFRVSKTFGRYRILKKYMDMKVFNCTEGSLLDVFPQIKLEDVLRKLKLEGLPVRHEL